MKIEANSVEEYIISNPAWQANLILLRAILRSAPVKESLKWGIPVYSVDSKNVAGMAAFKNYVAIWFFQGALLRDKKRVLVNAQEGTTRALRQWRFHSFEEIEKRKEDILAYLHEAIKNQQQGKEIKARKNIPLIIPEELMRAMQKDAALKSAFNKFTLSQQRKFADHIAGAKKEETRQRRLEKIIPMIRDGKGLNDKCRK